MSKKLVFLGILLTPLCMCFVGLITFSPGELGFVLSLSHASEVDVKKQDKSAESIGSKTSQQNPLTRYPINKLKDTYQSEVIEIIFGTLISLIGLFCIIIAVIKRKSNDYTLAFYGALNLVYAARTSAYLFFFDFGPGSWDYWRGFITYILPIFAWLFFEQLLGRGWKSSIRYLIFLQILFSTVEIITGFIFQAHLKAMIANNVIVIIGMVVIFINLFNPNIQKIRRLRVLKFGAILVVSMSILTNLSDVMPGELPFIKYWEPFGFFVFMCCLTYIVLRRFFDNEKELITIASELETARQIQSFILPGDPRRIPTLNIAARYVPMVSVAGDIYDFVEKDNRRLGILIADVSGHGVPASLISSMVKIAFVSQAHNASHPDQLLTGINQILCGKLDSDFVTAGYLFIDTGNETAIYSGAGHPPLICWRASDQRTIEHQVKGPILGQIENAVYQNVSFSLESGDRVFLYTDGLFELPNKSGEMFGLDRFKNFIKSNDDKPADEFADDLIRHITDWSGKKLDEEGFDDDLTLIIVDVGKP